MLVRTSNGRLLHILAIKVCKLDIGQKKRSVSWIGLKIELWVESLGCAIHMNDSTLFLLYKINTFPFPSFVLS